MTNLKKKNETQSINATPLQTKGISQLSTAEIEAVSDGGWQEGLQIAGGIAAVASGTGYTLATGGVGGVLGGGIAVAGGITAIANGFYGLHSSWYGGMGR